MILFEIISIFAKFVWIFWFLYLSINALFICSCSSRTAHSSSYKIKYFLVMVLLDFEMINNIIAILVIRVNHVWQKRTLIDFRFCLTQVDPSYWFALPINSVIGRHSLRLTCVSFRLFRAGELWISSLRPFKRFFIESNAFCNSWGFFCVVAWANSRT